MKYFIFLFFMLSTFLARATDYYVSAIGNDANNGLSSGASWQTLAKVNSSTFNPGDKILFKRGDTFFGTLNISNSGNLSNKITYDAYGTGTNPILTGFITVVSWNNVSGNLWESTDTVATNLNPNIVLINGAIAQIGRTPNADYNFIDGATNTSITDTWFSGNNWTGAELLTRDEKFILSRRKITSQVGNTVNFAGQGYPPKVGWGFFVQSDIRTLDTQNEWYFNPITKKITVYSVGTPAITKVTTIAQNVTNFGKHHIIYKNLAFEGANSNAIIVGYSSFISVDSCEFRYNGDMTVYCQDWNSGYAGHFSLKNSTFLNNVNSGLILEREFIGSEIVNNTFTNTGMFAGMGGVIGSSDEQQTGMVVLSDSSLIEANRLTNTGANGMRFEGTNTIVKNNFIEYFAMLKGDQGAIYSIIDKLKNGKQVIGNVINYGGYGNSKGTINENDDDAHGIYMDNSSHGTLIKNNSISNVAYSGIFINTFSDSIIIRDNNVFNTGEANILNIADSFITIKNNKFLAKNIEDFNVYSRNPSTRIFLMDSNYYAKPIDSSISFYTDFNSGTYSLTSWRVQYPGLDVNSKISPKSVTDTSQLRYEYNATNAPKEVTLGNSYIDLTGKFYLNSVTLPAYSSIILIREDNIPPVIESIEYRNYILDK